MQGAQFGGEVTDYKNGLKFVTFHGSGHMVRTINMVITNQSAFSILTHSHYVAFLL